MIKYYVYNESLHTDSYDLIETAPANLIPYDEIEAHAEGLAKAAGVEYWSQIERVHGNYELFLNGDADVLTSVALKPETPLHFLLITGAGERKPAFIEASRQVLDDNGEEVEFETVGYLSTGAFEAYLSNK